MRVVLVIAGDVIVDDRIHVRNINAAGGHIGGDQDGQFAFPEVLHDLVPLFLGEVAMQAIH